MTEFENDIRHYHHGTKLRNTRQPAEFSTTVTRAAKDGTWIDVFIYDNRTRTSWSKRLRLPLADSWSVVP